MNLFWGSSETKTAVSRVETGAPVIRELQRKDLELVCSGNGTETQTFYFKLENGIFGWVQYAWAKITLATNLQTNVVIYVPGKPTIFETLEAKDVRIQKDKISISSKLLSITWNEDLTDVDVCYNNNNAKGKNLEIDLKFSTKSKGYKVGDGINQIAGGTAMHTFLPEGKVTAKVTAHEQEFDTSAGLAIYIYARSIGVMPQNVGAEWNMSLVTGKLQSSENQAAKSFIFSLMHYITPKKSGSVTISQGALIREGKPEVYFWDNEVDSQNHIEYRSSGYLVPRSLIFTLRGKTKDGRAARLSIHSNPDVFMLEIDILGEMNPILRALVQTFITKPFIYEWFNNNCVLELTIEGEETEVLSGSAFHELTFIK
ncbi:Survival factor 2 [Zancudomyces culisetae]|uniref:Survival factor 2 n=1 Tax=Zancudomyces culisetae TaxID=1213189 RepID=A0A1R1PH43_ZANCU|nr:Survival factor 2 [Zancudomyces culisetae]OMH85647.1 Survival factor 2 [Zancudomyces culisetae]|eukprot:OMH80294.1 Survival factor 2 [Zancudomyces culisetae]